MSDTCVDLQLDRIKLNPQFDGYKLSLENIPQYKVEIDKQDVLKLADSQYSYVHVKSFGNCNALFHDPWYSDTVYFIDEKWKLQKFVVHNENKLGRPQTVLQIPQLTECNCYPERIAVSLTYPSPDWVILTNGCGLLYVIKTCDRKEDLPWKIIHKITPIEESTPFRLLHSLQYSDDNHKVIDCLFIHVDNSNEDDVKKYRSQFKSVVHWLTFESDENGASINLKRTRRLEGGSAPDYAAIEPEGKAVIVASEKPFEMVYDSLKPVTLVKEKIFPEFDSVKMEDSEKDESCPAVYLWHQTHEDVNLYFILPPASTKSDVTFKVKSNHLKVALKSGEVLVCGELHKEVDVEESTWVVSNLEVKSDVGDFVKPDQLRLQVILSKTDSSEWTTVIVGDDHGKCVTDESHLMVMQETMANFQTALNPNCEEAQKPSYNVQELEECDAFLDEQSVLLRIDGETHKITHQVNLGSHQWLFNCQSECNKLPSFCIRHDVDGVVWQLGSKIEKGNSPWDHIATFDAFGYVQASKQQRKFTSCSPDFTYAVIADDVRHLYLYWQPTSIMSPVRNRKTGKKIDSVAKQQLVSLETVEPITGLYAANDKLFILAGDVMHVFKVKQD